MKSLSQVIDESFWTQEVTSSINEDAKDDKRINDIITKSNGKHFKADDLAKTMAKSIKDVKKAERRYNASLSILGSEHSVTRIFFNRAAALGADVTYPEAPTVPEIPKEKLTDDDIAFVKGIAGVDIKRRVVSLDKHEKEAYISYLVSYFFPPEICLWSILTPLIPFDRSTIPPKVETTYNLMQKLYPKKGDRKDFDKLLKSKGGPKTNKGSRYMSQKTMLKQFGEYVNLYAELDDNGPGKERLTEISKRD